MAVTDRAVRAWAKMPMSLKRLYYQHGTRLSAPLARIFFADQQRVVAVQGGILKGLVLDLNPRAERGLYSGVYEQAFADCLPNLVQPGMTVFNIGANIGYFTLALARLVGPNGSVVAFEPAPQPLKRLRRHVELNHLANVKIEPVALSDFNGTAIFSLGSSQAQGRFEDLPYVKPTDARITVECLTLDTYLDQKNIVPHLVLLDVEHAEGRVLRGMSQTLTRHQPILLIEMHGAQAIQEAYAELAKHHYRIARLPEMNWLTDVSEISSLEKYIAVAPTQERELNRHFAKRS